MIFNYQKIEEFEPCKKALRRDFARLDTDAIRQKKFDKQSGLCFFCEDPLQDSSGLFAQLDHLVSVHHWATWNYTVAARYCNREENLVVACPRCNSIKQDKGPEEFLEAVERGEVTLPGEPKILTPEQIAEMKAILSERGRKGALALNALRTPEQRHEWARKVAASMTLEQRREYGRKGALATNASMTFEQKQEIGRKAGLASVASTTLEQRRENGRKGAALFTPEQRRENGRKGALATNASMTFEQKQEIGRKAGSASVASLTPEQLQERARKASFSRTPEQRRESGRKGGLKGGRKSAHLRWHINRNRPDPCCALCSEEGLIERVKNGTDL